MNVYEPFHPINSWIDCYREDDTCPNISASDLLEVEEKFEIQVESHSEDTLHVFSTPPNIQEAPRSSEKMQRRLAQNREAARKCRLRKKAYVLQLESSRLKLAQMEQELQRARQQGFYVGSGIDHLPLSSPINSGVATFEMEYGNWMEEQKRQICELRSALESQKTDVELRILVETSMKHYFNLFRLKAAAAKTDIFYLMSGMWKSPAERFFFWLGGFRPSELLKVLVPLIEPLTGKQDMEVENLTHSCQQAEDALTQGMERLQQNLAATVATLPVDDGRYISQMTIAVEKLDDLVSFVNQADHLRMETLQQMHRILTTRQAARGLLVLGEYFHRLKALSSLWSSRTREPKWLTARGYL
ncbi:hypothetical protein V2J09_021629 [Rumex salicifolius]